MDGGDFFRILQFGLPQQPLILQGKPVFGTIPEIATEAKGHVGGDEAASGQHVVDSLRGDMDGRRQPSLSESVVLQKITEQTGCEVVKGGGCRCWDWFSYQW